MATELNNTDASRIIPTIPLETFYRRFRRPAKGSAEVKFRSIKDALDGRHGPKNAAFLAELFQRSLIHSERYSNIGEAFYPESRKPRKKSKKFANHLVQVMERNSHAEIANHKIGYVDYEIYPFRTTSTCNEIGKPASRMGSGGIDVLLTSEVDRDGVLPGIGEIKANTETVGPTFALVQSLMYAAQLATKNQFVRLANAYPKTFNELKGIGQPRVDIIVLMDATRKPQRKKSKKNSRDDLQFAKSLAGEVATSLEEHIRQIVFLSCTIEGDQVTLEPLKDD